MYIAHFVPLPRFPLALIRGHRRDNLRADVFASSTVSVLSPSALLRALPAASRFARLLQLQLVVDNRKLTADQTHVQRNYLDCGCYVLSSVYQLVVSVFVSRGDGKGQKPTKKFKLPSQPIHDDKHCVFHGRRLSSSFRSDRMTTTRPNECVRCHTAPDDVPLPDRSCSAIRTHT